jgi:hypothetical protein
MQRTICSSVDRIRSEPSYDDLLRLAIVCNQAAKDTDRPAGVSDSVGFGYVNRRTDVGSRYHCSVILCIEVFNSFPPVSIHEL